ncbi:MAG: tyrosine--tRNA ligase [Candidatus Saccharimonadales bacterium]
MKLSEELQWRGFVNQTTLTDLKELDKKKFTLYFGVDPSADSMTVGNLAAAIMVRHFLEHGHKVILLVGGGTGMIGDPGGKNEERNLLTLQQVAKNKKGIGAEYKRVFSGKKFLLVDNYDWLNKLSLLEFLRDIGKHFGMTTLLQRDFIANRIGEGGSGISYTEFSYTLLQGYDYYYLHQKYGVDLQVCGADQWGNSISGVDLIRKKTGHEVHVYSCPLIINKSTGKKFGKSEGGAVWLNSDKTSGYKFYQFWLNADDEGVIDYMKVYTLLPKEEIEEYAKLAKQAPQKREAQKALAFEATKLVHGKERAESVRRVTEVLFGGRDFAELTAADRAALGSEIPTSKKRQLDEVLFDASLAKSKGEVRRLVGDGGVTINGEKADGEAQRIKTPALVKKGKNSFVLVV